MGGFKKPAAIKATVGNTGDNNRRDVAKVESLLGQTGHLDLKKTNGPTGFWGMRTEDAAKKFQKQNGLKVDGILNPGGPTLKALAQKTGLAAPNPAKPKPSAPKAERPNNIGGEIGKLAGQAVRAVMDGAAANSGSSQPTRKPADEALPQFYDEHLPDGRPSKAGQAIRDAFEQWHVKERKERNKYLPNSIRRAEKAGFVRYPGAQNTEHQDGKGRPEIKYGHPDGREVIFNGDTGKRIDDPRIEGTYNYVTPPPFGPDDVEAKAEDWFNYVVENASPEELTDFVWNGVIKHGLLDFVPYRIQRKIDEGTR